MGPRGSNLQTLQEETETYLEVSEKESTFPGTQEQIMLVEGDWDKVQLVFTRISNMIRKYMSTFIRSKSMTILVHKDLIPDITGYKPKYNSVAIKLQPKEDKITDLNELLVQISSPREVGVIDAGSDILWIMSTSRSRRISESLDYQRWIIDGLSTDYRRSRNQKIAESGDLDHARAPLRQRNENHSTDGRLFYRDICHNQYKYSGRRVTRQEHADHPVIGHGEHYPTRKYTDNLRRSPKLPRQSHNLGYQKGYDRDRVIPAIYSAGYGAPWLKDY